MSKLPESFYEVAKNYGVSKEEILFVTKQNTAFYMRKDPDYEYETGELSKLLSTFPNYRYRGARPASQPETKEE